MNKETILGLDVSTRTIGICLMDENKKLLDLKHISPKPNPKPESKLEELFKKVDLFKQFILNYKDKEISKVVIEQPLLNSNNLYTCETLIKFNGMVSRVIYDLFNIVPNFISSYDSRKYAFPELMQFRKFKKDGTPIKNLNKKVLFGDYPYDCDKKYIIYEKISQLYPEVQWVYNRNNILAKESFDMSDSVACCLAYLNLLKK